MNSKNYRARLLTGASVAVIASTLGMGMSVSFAQTVKVTTEVNHLVGSGAPAFTTINQFNTDTLLNATNTTGKIDATLTNSNSGPQIYNNLISAVGEGNVAIFSYPTPAGAISGPDALIISQSNSATPVTGTVNTATISASISAGSSGNVDVGPQTISSVSYPGNTITGQVILNNAANSISGPISGGAATTTTAGTVVFNYPPTGSSPGATLETSTGTTILSTSQYNVGSQQGAGSAALVESSTVGIILDNADTTNDLLNGPITLSGNTLSAIYDGNLSTASISALGGSVASTSGTLTLANLQINNTDAVGVGVAATNTASTVSVALTAAATYTNTLAAPLTISGNTISSSATGNAAFGASTEPGILWPSGNVITIGAGLSVDETDLFGTTGIVNTVTYNGVGGLSATLNADISLASMQANLSSPLSATTTDGLVTAAVQDMSSGTGSVTVGANAITSTVEGNNAFNLITSGVSTGITAVIGLQNVQTNDSSPMTASGSGNAITVNVATGTAGGSVSGAAIEVGASVSPTSTVVGSVGSTGNSIGISANGNEASNYVELSADSFQDTAYRNSPTDLAGPGLYLTGDRTSNSVSVEGANTLLPGSALVTVQSNLDDSAVTATNTAPTIALTVGTTTNGPPVAVTGSTIGLDNNTLQAVASGNYQASLVDVTVTDAFTGNFGIAAVQTQNGAVGSTLTSGQVSISIVPAFDGSAVSLTHNTLLAAAEGNYASNSIAVSTGTMLSNIGGAVEFHYVAGGSAGNPYPLDQPSPNTLFAFSALPILNDQLVESNVTASNTSPSANPVTLSFGGSFSGAANNDFNYFGAQATGNQAVNATTLTGVITSDTNSSSTFGGILNLQTVANGVSIASTASSSHGAIETTVSNSVDGAITLSNNEYQSSAVGNQVSNSATMSSPTSLSWNTSNTLYDLQAYGAYLVYATGMSVIDNGQSTGTGTISSSLSSGSVFAALGTTGGVSVGGAVTLNGNSFVSSAFDNQAANTISSTAVTALDATGTVMNFQESLTSTTRATAGTGHSPLETAIGFGFGDTVTSTLLVTGNSVGATAYANTASNSIVASSSNTADSQSTALLVADQGVQSPVAFDGSVSAQLGGDYALDNLQVIGGSVLAAAHGGAGIFMGFDTSLTGAATVSGNTVTAEAEGNVANNTATLAASNGSATATSTIALGNFQLANPTSGPTPISQSIRAYAHGSFGIETFGFGTISATSALTVSDNGVNAIALANNATNTIGVSAGNTIGDAYVSTDLGLATVSASFGATPTVPAGNLGASIADYAIANVQNNISTSTTALAAVESFFDPSGINVYHFSVDESALTVSGNFAWAQSASNSATNTLTLSAVNSSVATGSILNLQYSGASSSASAYGQIGIAVAGFDTSVTSSVLTVGGNYLLAEAWGNTATNTLTDTSPTGFTETTLALPSVPGPFANALNVLSGGEVILNEQLNTGNVSSVATGGIGVTSGRGSISDTTIAITGNAIQATSFGNNSVTSMVLNGNNASGIVGNAQENTGAINASSNGAGIGMTEGGVSGLGTVLNGSINISGNAIAAQAYGNATTTSLVLNGTSTSGAIISNQTNSGPVTATVTSATIGIASSGTITGTAMNVSSNEIVAMAVGNYASNTTHH